MRTTLIIDDDVAAAARHRAVSEGITLSALVTQALRAVLQEGSAPPDPPFSMVTWGATGPPLHLTPGELAAGPEPFALSPLVVGAFVRLVTNVRAFPGSGQGALGRVRPPVHARTRHLTTSA